MEYRIDRSGTLPGLNDYTSACRTNAYLGASLKKKTEKRIVAQIAEQEVPSIDGLPRVRFEWREKSRRRDYDNIAFGKKFVLDALVTARVLTGDGWSHLAPGFRDDFAVDRDNPGVTVILEVPCEHHDPVPDGGRDSRRQSR